MAMGPPRTTWRNFGSTLHPANVSASLSPRTTPKIACANPEAGSLITDGVHPPVRYLDCDVLRVFHQIFESEKIIIIIGFRTLA